MIVVPVVSRDLVKDWKALDLPATPLPFRDDDDADQDEVCHPDLLKGQKLALLFSLGMLGGARLG